MPSTPINVADNDFQDQVLSSELPVLVDFWAPWCGPCRFVAPVLDQLADEQSERLVVAKVNTDSNQQIAAHLGIQGIPTMILFKDGREIDRVVGALPKPALEQWLDRALS